MVAEPERLYTYSWDSRSPLKGDAEEAEEIGLTLERLCGEGLGAGELRRAALEEARSEDSPLHRFPTWDDKAAAEERRLSQIGAVILSIVRVHPETGFPMDVPAFQYVQLLELHEEETEDGETEEREELVRQWAPTLALLNSEEGQEAMKRRAVELIGWHLDRLTDFEDMEFLVKAIRKAQRLVGLL